MTDPFAVLGVSPDASGDEIKRAYRALALRFHPDHNPGDPTAEARFKEITAAHEAIRSGTAQRFHAGPGRANYTAEDMREAMRAYAAQKNRDVRVTVTIGLEDSFHGTTMQINVPTSVGARPTSVRIPRGADVHHVVRVSGGGEWSYGSLPFGDLHVSFRFRPHPVFHRMGDDLRSKIDVGVFDIMLGCKRPFTCIDGTEIMLVIPAGAQPGQLLRVPSHGMPRLGSESKRGDLLVELGIVLPPLNDEQKLLVERARAAGQTDATDNRG